MAEKITESVENTIVDETADQKEDKILNQGEKSAKNSIKNSIKRLWTVNLDSIYKTPETDEEKKQIKKIQNFNRIEFIVALGLIFGSMWTFWWQGILRDNNTLMTIGFGIIGLVAVWAILISPFVHYEVEKGITYRKGYLGLDYEQNGWTAFFEERGLGSIKRYYDDTLKDPKQKHLVNYMALFVVITTFVTIFYNTNDYDGGVMRDLGEMMGMGDPFLEMSVVISFITAFEALSIILLVYGTYVAGQWKNTGNNDTLKKILLIVPAAMLTFSGILLFWAYGLKYQSDGSWQILWDPSSVMFQTAWENFWPMGAYIILIWAIVAILFFVAKFFANGILIRFDNIKSGAKQFVIIAFISIFVVFSVAGILSIPAVTDYTLAHQSNMITTPSLATFGYIFEGTVAEAFNEHHIGHFLANFAYYIYWGGLQEFLFLGYFCTLLTKCTKNKFVVAFGSSAVFGLIHFPSWPLMLLTMTAGFFWAMAWMRNDSRNLFILGASHGFGGTIVAKFTNIEMAVGPSNMA